jgi:uncharacterized protein YwqG
MIVGRGFVGSTEAPRSTLPQMSIPERERHIIETRLAEYDLSRFAPAFVASARRCLRLSSRRADVAVGRSKVGGDPDLPPGTPWPSCEGRAMTFLAQLDLADVASRIESPLPTSGLVSFFFDRSTMSEDNGLVVFTRGLVERRPAPGERFEECAIDFNPTVSVPSVRRGSPHADALGLRELGEDERDALEEWASNLNHWFGAEEGHQLLGYPHSWRSDVLVQNVVMWREDLATALEWRNLLAFETDEAAKMQWADGGHCWFLIEHVALEAGELERARATVQLG